MSDIAKIVGDRIRKFRNEQGLSQEELAHRADINPSHLGRLERGEKSATLDSLEKVVGALGLNFDDVFKFIQPSSANSDEDNTLALLINKLLTLAADEQKQMLELFDVLFRMMHKS